MARFKAPRGTRDVLPSEQPYWRYVKGRAEAQARLFGYQPVDTPLFEDAALFVRGVGLGTDIVEKEMYVLEDRGGDRLALRPEGTAPVCRAYLEHGMYNLPQPVRLYYVCPIFRYERPQAGRYRQHYQFGVECLGDEDALVDAEVIELAWSFVASLGLRGIVLCINSIGDRSCRPAYVEALKAHYLGRLKDVCPDCRMRFERSPLRVLDCKRTDFACQEMAAEAPNSLQFLCADCGHRWKALLGYLASLEIPYEVDTRLVRGLDYYTRTVFEIQPLVARAQGTVLAGGRYDGLIEELGGPPTPGIGFGSGIERLIENLKAQGVTPTDYKGVEAVVAWIGDAARQEAVKLSASLKRQGISTLLAPTSKSLKGQMRYASAQGARYVLILGEEELSQGTVVVREMAKGEQKPVERAALLGYLTSGTV